MDVDEVRARHLVSQAAVALPLQRAEDSGKYSLPFYILHIWQQRQLPGDGEGSDQLHLRLGRRAAHHRVHLHPLHTGGIGGWYPEMRILTSSPLNARPCNFPLR